MMPELPAPLGVIYDLIWAGLWRSGGLDPGHEPMGVGSRSFISVPDRAFVIKGSPTWAEETGCWQINDGPVQGASTRR